MQTLYVDPSGRLMISQQALLNKKIFTSDSSYRSQKRKGRLEDVKIDGMKWVFVDSLTRVSREKVLDRFADITRDYKHLLNDMTSLGEDCAPLAVEFTAESLQINEPFIRSTIEMYMNTHYIVYTGAYLDLGLHSNSVKGYAKQCALVQWIADFAKNIKNSEADAKRCELLLRSFRMNLLTSLNNIKLEIKVPQSEVRFNKWFDDVITSMDNGKKPQDIIQVKRLNNSNAGKITPEQFNIVAYWHINGINQSVPTLHRKWLEWGKQSGWWMDENGNFNPPTEARLYQLLSPLKNANSQEKTDPITYRANNIPSVSRDLPEKKNHVWVIDGTAQNENVLEKGTVRQHIYAIKVADVATLRMVGVSTLIGVKEPFYAVKEAILMGIRETGYKPAIIHCDRGPAWKELERWCEANEVKLYPSITGNARAKTIESMFNMFDNDITRFLKGYSGQNRTALSQKSRSSEKRENIGKQHARSAAIAMQWAKGEGMKVWNERVIETLENKPCNKTPFELWEQKESYVPKLSYSQLCVLCGTLHEKKLTINGIDIEHKTKAYTYFPSIDTPEQRQMAEKIFTYIPLDSVTANKMKIYILNGGEPAPVYAHDGTYLGVWGLKTNTAYIAETADQKATLNNFMALQYRVEQKAKEINAGIKNSIERHPDFERIEAMGNEMLTGKRRPMSEAMENERKVVGRYDKSALLEDEQNAKSDRYEGFTDAAKKFCEAKQYREYVDPDTGEIHKIEIKTN